MSYFDEVIPKKPPPIDLVLRIPTYKKHFVNIKRLKAQLDQIQLTEPESQARPLKENTFQKLLDDELTKLNEFCLNKMTEISLSINFVAKKVQSSAENRLLLEQEIDALGEDLYYLDSFVGLNYITLTKMVERYDSIVGSMASVWFQARLDQEPFCNIKFDGVLLNLSDVYYTFTHGNEEKCTWAPPDSFDRQTTKFFVRPEHVIKVKTLIVKHLPTLVFDRTQGVHADWTTDLDFSLTDSAPITSVYFDNVNCDQYHARLNREEGATLIRIRWYGKYGKTVFIEQKTHHESWVEAMSVKERFELRSKRVKKYLDAKWQYERMVPKLQAAGVKPETISKNWALANEIQNNIIKNNLKPVLRTTYARTAFQLTSTNHVRISIDTDLRITKEPEDPGPGNWAHLGQFPPKDVLNFPLAVLEIKLHDFPPKWVLDLFTEGYLIRAERFSKFQHGTAYHYYNNIKVRPHWFDNNLVNLHLTEGCVWYSPGGITLAERNNDRLVVQKTAKTRPVHHSKAQKNNIPQNFLDLEIEPINPQKTVEPKIYLASERMLVKWLKLMLMWSGLGIYFTQRRNLPEVIAGYLLLCSAVILLCHQMYQYRIRQAGIRMGVTYEDRVGPNVLVPLMMVAIVFAAIFEFTVDNGGHFTLSKSFWFVPSSM